MDDEASTTNVNFPGGWNPLMAMMNGGKGMSGSALGIGIAGLVAGGLALLGARLGNTFGGGNCNGVQFATTRDLEYERKLTQADAENGQLKAQIYCDEKVDAVRKELAAAATAQAVLNERQQGAIGILAEQTKRFAGMQMSILKPQVLAPSQAVLTSATSAKADAAAGSDGQS